MDDDEAREAYLALAAALESVGFGWVVQQVESALYDDRKVDDTSDSSGPTWVQQLVALLPAIRIAVEAPAQLARSLIPGPLAAADVAVHDDRLAPPPRYLLDDEQVQSPEELWPFTVVEIRASIELLLQEIAQ